MTESLYEVRVIIDGLQLRSSHLPMDEAIRKAEVWRGKIAGATLYIKKVEEIAGGSDEM